MKRNSHHYHAFIPLACSLALLFGCAKDFPLLKDDALGIDSITPTKGYAGSTIRVYGKGFAAARDSNHVFVNGIKANVIDPNSLGVLLVSVPPAASTGPVSIKVYQQAATGPVFTIEKKIPFIEKVALVGGSSIGFIQSFNLNITGANFSTDAKRLSLYYNNQAVPVISAGLSKDGKPQAAGRNPSSNEDNPLPVVIASDGLRSAPYLYTTRPILKEHSASYGPNVSLTLNGSYFGYDFKGNELVVRANGVRIYPATKIDKWSTGQIIVSLTLKYGTYRVSVKVNGLESSAVNVVSAFQPPN